MDEQVVRLRAALVRFDGDGQFGEGEYEALRRVCSRITGARAAPDLLDGLINMFFERHVLDDRRRRELLALGDEELFRAVRHRFRQVVADEREDQQPYHALRPHVRDALEGTPDPGPATDAAWPTSLRERGRFERDLIDRAVKALWLELRARPSVKDATAELLRRYAGSEASSAISEAHEVPEAIRRRMDGQRLAANILNLLTSQERALLRHVLEEGSVEDWAESSGCSRATGYRLMARLKALCRLEFAQRSNHTQLEALQALRGKLAGT